MREGVDEHREPEHVRPEDELLAPLVRDLAGRRQQPDRGLPLLLCQPRFGREGVQVPDEALQQRAQTLVGTALEARDDRRGDVGRARARAARPRLLCISR